MTEIRSTLSNLRRPRLLIRAVRFGAADYRRERDLRRLIGRSMPPDEAVQMLLDAEGKLEEWRRRGTAGYSVAQHIEMLIALVSEAKLATSEEV